MPVHAQLCNEFQQFWFGLAPATGDNVAVCAGSRTRLAHARASGGIAGTLLVDQFLRKSL